MDIFGNNFDIHINVNGTEYTGEVTVDDEGRFDTGLEPQNYIETFGHFYGDILRNGDDSEANYVVNYLFEQRIVCPEIPVLHSFTGQAELHITESDITFSDENITGLLHSLKKPVKNEIPADNEVIQDQQ